MEGQNLVTDDVDEAEESFLDVLDKGVRMVPRESQSPSGLTKGRAIREGESEFACRKGQPAGLKRVSKAHHRQPQGQQRLRAISNRALLSIVRRLCQGSLSVAGDDYFYHGARTDSGAVGPTAFTMAQEQIRELLVRLLLPWPKNRSRSCWPSLGRSVT